MGARIPAEIFPPGEFLKDELEARSWTQIEFSEIIGKDTRLVSEIISGKRSVTPETAIAFGEALGTGPELWMNLESQFQLSKARPAQSFIARKAQLHGKFPVREMIKRGWIQGSKSIEVLEFQVFNFFGVGNLHEVPSFSHVAKKTSYEDASMLQVAWLCRARDLARSAPAGIYVKSKLDKLIIELKFLTESPENVQKTGAILSKAGIRFVIVESLPSCKIDGACFWLDEKSPVIALSLRFDRVDNFWHSLFHELDHIRHEEGKEQPIIDVDLGSDDYEEMPKIEIRANKAAAETLIPKKEIDGFIARVSPMFSDQQIIGFAKRIHVHPGIVIGQLQNRKLIPYSFYRKYLVKVREYLVQNVMTDGFGQMFPSDLE